MGDSFIRGYDASEIEVAAEFLTNWLPFLTGGLCDGCSAAVRDRIRSLRPGSEVTPAPSGDADASDAAGDDVPHDIGPRGFEHIEPTGWDTDPDPTPEPTGPPATTGWDVESEPSPQQSGSDPEPEKTVRDMDPPAPVTPKVRMSWADMAQEDELEEEEEEARSRISRQEVEEGKKKPELSRVQREQIRFRNVGRKKDFICLERVNGKIVNILDGLELHTGVFSAAEQKRIVDFVYELQEKGRNNQFGEHTYSQPRKWMRGKGRVTIQFGCCYNYAAKNGVLPGILENVVADPLPPLFKVIIKRLVRWHVLPTTCTPDSCIVNIYEPEDCIPPHIDSHDFVRPFTTVSFLSECDILFGSNLRVAGPGEFTGSTAISLPVGSVLVLNGNGADVAKHCVPAVPTKRISITFRKMDESKKPIGFTPEPDLQNILPLLEDSGGIRSQNGRGATGPQNELLDVESKRWQNRNSRGRSSRAKPVPDFGHRPHFQYDADTPTRRSSHRDFDARSSMSGGSMDRGRESFGRSFDSKTIRPDLRDNASLRDDDDHSTRRSQRPALPDEGSGTLESSREYNGRRVQLQQQQRIVVSRNMVGEEESARRGPMGSGEYSGRGESSDQDRFVISRRRNEGEEEPAGMGGGAFEPANFSRIRVQSLSNGRRRVSLTD